MAVRDLHIRLALQVPLAILKEGTVEAHKMALRPTPSRPTAKGSPNSSLSLDKGVVEAGVHADTCSYAGGAGVVAPALIAIDARQRSSGGPKNGGIGREVTEDKGVAMQESGGGGGKIQSRSL